MFNGMVRYGSFRYSAHDSHPGCFLLASRVFVANGGAAIAAMILAPLAF